MVNLEEWIKRHENFKSHPYIDTVGKLTIGWGRNIEDNGISLEEGNYLFQNDFKRCQMELMPFPWYRDQPMNVQYALMDMCFNLGITKLLEFHKMIMALTAKNYEEAAKEALESEWAKQVGYRAEEVSLMMTKGF